MTARTLRSRAASAVLLVALVGGGASLLGSAHTGPAAVVRADGSTGTTAPNNTIWDGTPTGTTTPAPAPTATPAPGNTIWD